MTLRCCMTYRKGPVCRQNLVLLYLCMLLLQESFAPEPNPSPRTPKFPCAVCNRAVRWSIPGVQCDSCDMWYHTKCMGMCEEVYQGLHNVSWECVNCGIPNFSSGLFDLTLFESINTYDPLKSDLTCNSEFSDISFNNGLPHLLTRTPRQIGNVYVTTSLCHALH